MDQQNSIELEKEIKKSTHKALVYVLSNPSVFFSEADIQSIFYKYLTEIDELSELQDTACSIGVNQNGDPSPLKYKTTLIHREYGLNKDEEKSIQGRMRVDIAIFNESEVNDIIHPINLKKKGGKYMTPDYIFEFGTEKSASSIEALKDHVANDLTKLSGAKNRGFLIHIHRNYLKGPNSERNRKKFIKYWEHFDIHINTNALDKIKILAFQVDVGGDNRRVSKGGKIRMYEQGIGIKGVNQNKIADKLKGYLQL